VHCQQAADSNHQKPQQGQSAPLARLTDSAMTMAVHVRPVQRLAIARQPVLPMNHVLSSNLASCQERAARSKAHPVGYIVSRVYRGLRMLGCKGTPIEHLMAASAQTNCMWNALLAPWTTFALARHTSLCFCCTCTCG